MLVIGSYELPEVGNEELGSSGREAMLLTQSSLQHLDWRHHFEAVYTRSVRDQQARVQVGENQDRAISAEIAKVVLHSIREG